ncbi:secreted protein [Ostreid herpesvirus 1]|uniref:Uncharacterized protein n=1 Tax=Ostreid herpesvirus 1 TaxID=261939 RepID=V9QLE0_OSHV1|nr:hypothetical protein [Ostreid herpesvirus 1]AHC31209.1 hypothetical protein [Ostreid herpesvirus 1]AHC31210.1 hypothetical protein [Ostreid herpesvirus 1]AHC31211.1 hypothetical protein [Ostreid herpesvirus 1]AHC31212.1 hypothetical protein [Ostreid herpesvirus 1]
MKLVFIFATAAIMGVVVYGQGRNAGDRGKRSLSDDFISTLQELKEAMDDLPSIYAIINKHGVNICEPCSRLCDNVADTHVVCKRCRRCIGRGGIHGAVAFGMRDE